MGSMAMNQGCSDTGPGGELVEGREPARYVLYGSHLGASPARAMSQTRIILVDIVAGYT